MSKGRREGRREAGDESEEEEGAIVHFKIPLTLKKEEGALEGDKEEEEATGMNLYSFISPPPPRQLLFLSIPALAPSVSASVMGLFLSPLSLCFPVKVCVFFLCLGFFFSISAAITK